LYGLLANPTRCGLIVLLALSPGAFAVNVLHQEKPCGQTRRAGSQTLRQKKQRHRRADPSQRILLRMRGGRGCDWKPAGSGGSAAASCSRPGESYAVILFYSFKDKILADARLQKLGGQGGIRPTF